ncbi:response regulator with CheY-like receiver, AAA-type ATPase, and DNA-binding domains [Terriglobus roseus DSM 18391]|uniref:Response regulator with CheY-like receiver, AAA-type ATPase, and DNA-binding domains n=1 Tax=Terriglobus roseus (strain DSM 18391 / NRRL B-41598 / KBS 63) TaxID=926566 RepID=I3ZJX0_TERRK|nr:response regulator [Terriglobus roseus]AFL89538.1 response regulator with CheY-like receiver, AAA-type ATPase, and DNA-binding domains [Terriglobus roseus DSM 18391]
MRNGRSLLLVDDDETTRDLLSMLLGGEGWQITVAKGGEESLRIVSQSPPDVILSDLQMPGLCGAPMATALRVSMSALSEMPLLIAMTATTASSAPAGFDDLIQKPFDPGDLLRRCEALWNGKLPATPGACAMDATEPVIAIESFYRMKAAMPAAQLRSLYDFALVDAEARIARMSEALETSDDTTYRREAHALKGSCAMVGALRLRTLASTAEETGLPSKPLTGWKPLQHFREELGQIRHMLESLLPSTS